MLTGRFRFRRSWRGKHILQVEYRTRAYCPGEPAGVPRLEWRDAKADDAYEIILDNHDGSRIKGNA